MAKPGDAYQDAVAATVRQLDPEARIDVGEWIEGPDGARDCDVGVRLSSPGTRPFVFIECKDRKRPVGIEFIDALESKRKDVRADIAMICSNSRFTADALTKAARVGIIAISALAQGDSRIRVQVEEEIYTRNIKVRAYNFQFHFEGRVKLVESDVKPATGIIHDNRPFLAWVRDRALALVTMTAKSCDIVVKYTFWRPLQFHFKDKIAPVNAVTLTFPCEVQWCSQSVRLDASSGMYDYLHKRMTIGKGSQQYSVHNVDDRKWKVIDFIPEQIAFELEDFFGDQPGVRHPAHIWGVEIKAFFASVSGIDTLDGVPAPDINSYVESETIERIDLTGKSFRTDWIDREAQEKATALIGGRPALTPETKGEKRMAARGAPGQKTK